MITINEKWKYKVKFVKFPLAKYTSFSVGVKVKDSNDYVNYQMFALKKYDNLVDGDEIQITKIISTEQAEYNGKQQLKVTCEFDIVNGSSQEQVYYNQETASSEPILSIQSDDLPF